MGGPGTAQLGYELLRGLIFTLAPQGGCHDVWN